MTNLTIGSIATFNGVSHPYLNGYRVRVECVLKGANAMGFDPDVDEYYRIDDADELARAGGITHEDVVIVAPWIEKAERFSFVTSDVDADELTPA